VSGADPRRAVARRRRNALIGVGTVAAVVGVIVGAATGGGGDDGDEAAAPAAAEAPTCPDKIASSDSRLVGGSLMVRMEDTATDELVALARHGELGGVILFPSTGISPSVLADQVDRLKDAARKAGFPEPLVAIDQEGGDVQRLPGEPPDVAPSEMAVSGGPSSARAQGLVTGNALARIGIDIDLAPVLDLGTPGSFVASRTFGDDPKQVAALGVAFADGLDDSQVAATAKHFPGLGPASANTDLGPSVVDASKTELESDLQPFEAAIDASVPLIMVSNATYSAYDPDRPASVSPRVIGGLLRGSLGYDGVVITDDLDAGALTGAGLDQSEAAAAAAQAGTDLVLIALDDGSAARAGLLAALRHGSLRRADLVEACTRLTLLRERLASPTGAR
jgi:beta-N-acetylhexosaminidase